MRQQVGGGTSLASGASGMIGLLVADANTKGNQWCEAWFLVSFLVAALFAIVGLYVVVSAYLPLPMPRTLEERRAQTSLNEAERAAEPTPAEAFQTPRPVLSFHPVGYGQLPKDALGWTRLPSDRIYGWLMVRNEGDAPAVGCRVELDDVRPVTDLAAIRSPAAAQPLSWTDDGDVIDLAASDERSVPLCASRWAEGEQIGAFWCTADESPIDLDEGDEFMVYVRVLSAEPAMAASGRFIVRVAGGAGPYTVDYEAWQKQQQHEAEQRAAALRQLRDLAFKHRAQMAKGVEAVSEQWPWGAWVALNAHLLSEFDQQLEALIGSDEFAARRNGWPGSPAQTPGAPDFAPWDARLQTVTELLEGGTA